jgi:hypothetical protein
MANSTVIIRVDILYNGQAFWLAVQAPEKMAMVQKGMIDACAMLGKPSLISRVVDTMAASPRPTRCAPQPCIHYNTRRAVCLDASLALSGSVVDTVASSPPPQEPLPLSLGRAACRLRQLHACDLAMFLRQQSVAMHGAEPSDMSNTLY